MPVIHPEGAFGAFYRPVVADQLISERKGQKLSVESTKLRQRLLASPDANTRLIASGEIPGLGWQAQMKRGPLAKTSRRVTK